MKIKYRLTLYFSLLVACILAIFSISIYTFYLKHRQDDFQVRLKNKAINTVTLLNTKPFDIRLLKIIDHSSVTNMDDLIVVVLDSASNFLYSNRDNSTVNNVMPVFRQLNWKENNSLTFNNKIFLGFPYHIQERNFILLVSARDLYGDKELKKLLTIILVVFVFSLALIVVAGFVNARQSLKPIREIIQQVDEIKGSNLNVALQTRNKDEIAELTDTFNKMLDRIRLAFEREKFFVSNASHELRTPLTSIKGQIEVALIKKRGENEYIKVLQSVLDDIENMNRLTNGFLELAEASADPSTLSFKKIRADELVFSIKEEFTRRNLLNIIEIEFKKLPKAEQEVQINGNYGLLWIMFINLVDNACKFSQNDSASLNIDFDESSVIIEVKDNGIGIPADELGSITQPLYRAQNAKKLKGHGLGLSIAQRIAELHHANLNISSQINHGTCVSIAFPKNS